MTQRRSILVVHTKPVPGREEEFQRWYSEVHLPEVVRVDGFLAASRFRYVPDGPADEGPDLPFLAIYDVEPGRIDAARQALADALESSRVAVAEGRTPVLQPSEALHEVRTVHWFEEIVSVSRDDD